MGVNRNGFFSFIYTKECMHIDLAFLGVAYTTGQWTKHEQDSAKKMYDACMLSRLLGNFTVASSLYLSEVSCSNCCVLCLGEYQNYYFGRILLCAVCKSCTMLYTHISSSIAAITSTDLTNKV